MHLKCVSAWSVLIFITKINSFSESKSSHNFAFSSCFFCVSVVFCLAQTRYSLSIFSKWTSCFCFNSLYLKKMKRCLIFNFNALCSNLYFTKHTNIKFRQVWESYEQLVLQRIVSVSGTQKFANTLKSHVTSQKSKNNVYLRPRFSTVTNLISNSGWKSLF